MGNSDRQSIAGRVRKGQRILEEKIEKEKVDFEIRDVIRAYPEDFPKIVKSLAEWSSQFE